MSQPLIHMKLFRRLNDAGTTIVQVTYSKTNVSYGIRTIQLFGSPAVMGAVAERR